MNLAGEELSNAYKPAIWLVGSASAEIIADIALCPFEMTKVKVQTSPTGTFPTAFGAAFTEMRLNKIETRFPFGSLVPLWSRQVGICTLMLLALSFDYMVFRFLTLWPSSSALKKLFSFSTRTYSLSRRKHIARLLN